MCLALTGQIALLSEARSVLRFQEQATETHQQSCVTLQLCMMHWLHEDLMDLLSCRKILLKVEEVHTSRSVSTWRIVEQGRERSSLGRTHQAIFRGRTIERQSYCAYKLTGVV